MQQKLKARIQPSPYSSDAPSQNVLYSDKKCVSMLVLLMLMRFFKGPLRALLHIN